MKNANKNECKINKTQQNSEPACNRKTPTKMKAKTTKPTKIITSVRDNRLGPP